jgi:hypothetical protein
LEQLARPLGVGWDPISGNNSDGPRDEYNSYAFRIVPMLSSRSRHSAIINYLDWAAADRAFRNHSEAKLLSSATLIMSSRCPVDRARIQPKPSLNQKRLPL